MAFVRKKGKSFYLVHNVRENGRVRQVHLACLGNRPRVSEEVVQLVVAAHPDLQIDWQAVRGRAGESFASPFADADGAQQLVRNLHSLVLDLHELDLVELPKQAGAVVPEILEQLQELREAIDQKLANAPSKRPQSTAAGEMKGGESGVESAGS
ncbi:MAG: hypothetical protein ACYC6M_00205 [Terriglobales bacterium]